MSQHQLRELSKIPKKICLAFSNATSSSRLFKFVGDFSHCKNLFEKANHALLLAAEGIYGSSLRRSELFMRLRCRTCKRRLKNFIALQILISESQIPLERVKRFIEESLSALRSLKTSKATHDSEARVSRGTQRKIESFPIGPERKHKVDFFALFYTTRLFTINYSISTFNGHPSHWQGK